MQPFGSWIFAYDEVIFGDISRGGNDPILPFPYGCYFRGDNFILKTKICILILSKLLHLF